ncbi:hypothetical protein Hanom_Chr10g00925351 [Helianthus anomalus]
MRYKFILHVLIQCLSNRHAGYDMAGNDLVGLMVALVLNNSFSISKYIYANMKENMKRTGGRTTGNKFWMYPRFLQMIMNVQHPNLPKADNDLLKIDTMIEHSLKIFRGVAANRYKESQPPRKLIGALDKTDHVAPENDKWHHNDSQSDDEEPKLKKMMEEKFGRKKINIFGDSTESDSDDDGDDEGGDSGDVGASAFYLDERGVRKVTKIRQEDDSDYVPSDTKAERLKKKQIAARRKKKEREYIGSSSVQQTVPQQEPIQEADMNPNFGLTADEAAAIISSSPRSS